ncbi:MAG: tRNA (adenosine(37)-N6)-threonylcarbamoyltransferase complex transferase subunit TsaD [Pseudomonadota bacterium]
MTHQTLILGIESSCDDTAAAVLRLDASGQPEVLSSVVMGQDAAHAPYGGVVPEIAARAHAQRLDEVVEAAFTKADIRPDAIDLVAATAGPGLIGGVMSGLTFAKGLAMGLGVPLIPVNHLAGHALSVFLEGPVPFPYLLLLVSGGHTQLLLVEGVTDFRRLGTTIDDAAGEAFDKTAKLLGLEGAGGPAIEALARTGDADAVALPRPLLGRPGCDFSFSGLKTAVRQRVDAGDNAVEDVAASFQRTAVAHLVTRTERAMTSLLDEGTKARHLVAAGGVAANGQLRDGLLGLAAKNGWSLTVPPVRYCTDNAAMIAYAGAVMVRAGGHHAEMDMMGFAPRARWPLDEDDAATTLGAGRKGRKV